MSFSGRLRSTSQSSSIGSPLKNLSLSRTAQSPLSNAFGTARRNKNASFFEEETKKSRPNTVHESEEEEDDDEEEDDADDDEEDESPSRRVNDDRDERDSRVDLSNNVYRYWTPEEQQEVLSFYGLDTLFPKAWAEDPNRTAIETTNQEQSEEAKKSSVALNVSTPLTPLPSRDAPAPTKIDTTDPLGVRDSILRKGRKLKPSKLPLILINDKQFDATEFLIEAHKSSSYRDLEAGVVNLKASIEHRNEVIKGLVKRHFSKFVSAKSTIDTFYKEMRQKNLIATEDYGIAPFLRALDKLDDDAMKLYGPILSRRSKADKIRVALSILEQWKFFFNLPSSLNDMIKKERYDVAVRDYRKGKYLMQSSFADLFDGSFRGENNGGTSATTPVATVSFSQKDRDASTMLPKNHREVFEKVWNEVERIIVSFRELLFSKLSISSTAVEIQEKIIGYLSDLEPQQDPVWCYLQSQHRWLIKTMVDKYTAHISKMKQLAAIVDKTTLGQSGSQQGNKNKISKEAPSVAPQDIDDLDEENLEMYLGPVLQEIDYWTLHQFKQSLATIDSHRFEALWSIDANVQRWKISVSFVKTIMDIIAKNFPDFWRICKMYTDGRFVKNHINKGSPVAESANNATREISNRTISVRHMVKSLFSIGGELLSRAFFLEIPAADIQDAIERNKRGGGYGQIATAFNSNADLKTNSYDALNEEDLEEEGDGKDSGGFDEATGDEDDLFLDEDIEKILRSLPKFSAVHAKFLASHPLVSCLYGARIMAACGGCLHIVQNVNMGSDISMILSLTDGFDMMRGRLVEVICEGFLRVSKNFYKYEDWALSAAAKVSTRGEDSLSCESTQIIKLYYRLSKFVMRGLQRIIAEANLTSKTTSEEQQEHWTAMTSKPRANPVSTYLDMIRSAFFESQYLILDGLEWLAAHYVDQKLKEDESREWLAEAFEEKWNGITFALGADIVISHFSSNIQYDRLALKQHVDLSSAEQRSFVVMGNLSYMKDFIIPKLCNLFENRFNLSISSEASHLIDTLDALEEILLKNCVRRHGHAIQTLIRTGILSSGFDWASVDKPSDVRDYCFHILLHLVIVHASISALHKSGVDRVMQELFLIISQSFLLCFRRVDSFSYAGMLQATLETDFLHQTLKAYETPATAQVLKLTYEAVEYGCTFVHQNISNTSRVNDKIYQIKGFLEQAQKATGAQFLCFRDPNSQSSEEED